MRSEASAENPGGFASNWRAIPVPPRMQHLPRDARGFPIPFMVYMDLTGRPHFTVNDEPKRMMALRKGLCSICGAPLLRGRWFVGGPLSAFHENGAYLDPPMHSECVGYALRVCPYLAAPRYSGRIDGGTIDKNHTGGKTLFAIDDTMMKDRPALFVALMAVGQRLVQVSAIQTYVKPQRPYRRIEYWRHGRQLAEAEGEAEAQALMARELPEMRPPRIREYRLE